MTGMMVTELVTWIFKSNPQVDKVFFEKFAILRSRQWPRGVEHQRAQMREEVSPPSSFLDLGVGFFSHYIEESFEESQAKNIPKFPNRCGGCLNPKRNTFYLKCLASSKNIYKSWKLNLKRKNVKFGVKFLFLNPSYYLSNVHVWSWLKKKKNTYRSSEFGTHDHLLYLSLSCDEPQKWIKVVRCCRNPMFFKKTLILRYTDMYTKRITVNMVWNVPPCFFCLEGFPY